MDYREFCQLDESEVESYVKKSLLFANACGFLTITVKGAMPSLPTLTEVKDFLQKYTTFPPPQLNPKKDDDDEYGFDDLNLYI